MKHLLLVICLLPLFSLAQKTYTVGPKETFFSIGRAINVHPRELAEFNNLKLEDGVKVGQVLKIPAVKKMAPLAETTPSANPTAATTAPATMPVTSAPAAPKPPTPVVANTAKPAEKPIASDMVPVYHKVQKKETLFQISQAEKVSIDDLKKWNKLPAEDVNEGYNLIVGYKKKEAAATTKAPEKKPENPVSVNDNKNAEKPVTPVTPTPAAPRPVVADNDSKPSGGIVRNFSGGYFKTAFAGQSEGKTPVNDEKGLAAIFKSTSGWNDGKYYCLHNTAPAGTIIKITNKSNQKFVYAKVLDVIPDLKQNEGLVVRLSNAAADELGVREDVFDVALTY